jgi:hypothetical protein
MDNFQVMQCLQTLNHLNKNGPALRLRYILLPFLARADLVQQVTTVCVLHHNAESRRCILEEAVLVRNDIWMPDLATQRGQ